MGKDSADPNRPIIVTAHSNIRLRTEMYQGSALKQKIGQKARRRTGGIVLKGIQRRGRWCRKPPRMGRVHGQDGSDDWRSLKPVEAY